MSKKYDELRSTVASLKGEGTILKVKDLEDKAFTLTIEATQEVNGTYGEQLLIVGTVVDGELEQKKGEEVRLYLNNKRQTTFETVYDGEGNYTFLFGNKVLLKNGFHYVPLELVVKSTD